MSDLTPEEHALLDAEARPRRGRPIRDTKPAEASVEPATCHRGPITPVQHDDDGWGDTPVQMRG